MKIYYLHLRNYKNILDLDIKNYLNIQNDSNIMNYLHIRIYKNILHSDIKNYFNILNDSNIMNYLNNEL